MIEKKGGGVVLYIHNSLNVKNINNFLNEAKGLLESITVELIGLTPQALKPHSGLYLNRHMMVALGRPSLKKFVAGPKT